MTVRLLRTAMPLALAAACVLAALPAAAQRDGDADDAALAEEKGHTFGVEIKAHFRDSDAERFGLRRLSDPAGSPPTAFLETVEAGEHFEVSTATVFYRGTWGEEGRWNAKAKIDFIDLHDRNPTSSDREWDIDELWLTYGRELEPDELHDKGFSGYVKLGKFAKFERQDDRHLESYGLISTASNRLEDVGVEVGLDFGRFFYAKGSITQGNPLFLRDVNALAGDKTLRPSYAQLGPPRELGSGFPILYDADVDEIDFDNPETGLALGLRTGDEGGFWSFNLMAFRYYRELADAVDLDNTPYDGDLALLLGPFNSSPLPITSSEKEEWGLTAWLYAGDLTLFAQYIDQEIAGLERTGFEVEVSYDIALPYWGALWGRQVLPFIAPAVRYSELDPEFGAVPGSLIISADWDWEKIDYGLRLGLLEGVADMTLEYNDNEFIRAGREESADEFLATLRLMWDWRTLSAF
ncbi:MAG: hypothetical protein AAF725_00720 [Acidobacteriota bacterium]